MSWSMATAHPGAVSEILGTGVYAEFDADGVPTKLASGEDVLGFAVRA